MEKSLFSQWVDKYFSPIIKKVVEKVNGSKDPLTYLHKTMLKKSYSTTMKWGSLSSNGTAVAADVVSMDSSLPLKKRDSLSKAEGDIPKIGMALYMNERTLSELDTLQRNNDKGSKIKIILQKLFGDAKKVVVGVYEQHEYMFQEALTTGYTTIANDVNTGVTVRINFQHPDSNKFGVEVKWSDTNAKPITDIENVTDRARKDGNVIKYLMMDRASWKNFRTKAEVKELFAAGLGFAGQAIPTPNLKQVNESLQSNYGLTIQIVDRTVTFEKDGKKTVKTPWASNVVVFLTSLEVGKLEWSTLAEMNHQKKDVNYEVADDYILVSKFHDNNPLREWTTSQALAVPVIDEVDSIYLMNSEEAEDETQTEGDADFDYTKVGETVSDAYTRVSVIAAINTANPDGPLAIASNTDATLQKKINKLDNAQIVIFEGAIVAA